MTHHAHYRRSDVMQSIAEGLGWFSIGLGIAELVAPKRFARIFGLEDQAELVRIYGLREIAAGVGILMQRNPGPWLWGRVAGDMLDLATLTLGLDRRNPRRHRAGAAFAAVAAVTVLDVIAAQQLTREGHGRRGAGFERLHLDRAPRKLRQVAETAYDRAREAIGTGWERGEALAERGWEGAGRAGERARRAIANGRADMGW